MGRPGAFVWLTFITFVGRAPWKKAFCCGKASCGALIDKSFLAPNAFMSVARDLSLSARDDTQGSMYTCIWRVLDEKMYVVYA